jgi:hypothetical protein
MSTDPEAIAKLAAHYGWSIEEATRRYRAAKELAGPCTNPVEYDAFMKKVERLWQSETDRNNLVQG